MEHCTTQNRQDNKTKYVLLPNIVIPQSVLTYARRFLYTRVVDLK